MPASRSIWKIVVIGIVVLIGFWIFGAYNAFVTSAEDVTNAWNQIETQYQRRIDLIPNLVNTVKGESSFEQETLTAVTEARTQWLNASASGNQAEQVTATKQLDSSLSRLLVTVESYPTLRATKGYEDLMVELEGTENRVAVARKNYNDTVRDFNVLVKRFPGNIVAKLFGFSPVEGFESEDGADQAPDVQF